MPVFSSSPSSLLRSTMALAMALTASSPAPPRPNPSVRIEWQSCGSARPHIIFMVSFIYQTTSHVMARASMHLLAAGHFDSLTAIMALIGGYRTIADIVGFHLSHRWRPLGGYSPRKAAAGHGSTRWGGWPDFCFSGAAPRSSNRWKRQTVHFTRGAATQIRVPTPLVASRGIGPDHSCSIKSRRSHCK